LSPPAWTTLVSLADYERDAALRTWVLALKHGGRRDLAQPLGSMLARSLAEQAARGKLELEGALVSSVPLHPVRQFVRGYDQAALLARFFALELGLPCIRALLRTMATAPQGSPGSSSRQANVRGAFRARRSAARRLSGRTVLLVDDVVTSGATAQECARCLRRAGAARVIVVCLARAGPRMRR
jgi:ComF family protein